MIQQVAMMGRYSGAVNLLDKHPDKLGDDIEVYQLSPPGYSIDGYFFKDNISQHRLPFMFSFNERVYLVILGSNLIGSIPEEFDVSWAEGKVTRDLKKYIDEICDYLLMDSQFLYLQFIGWQK